MTEHDLVGGSMLFVIFEDFALLDLAGPAEVFRAATLLGADPAYDFTVATPDGRPVRSSGGIEVSGDVALCDAASGAAHRSGSTPPTTLMVAGGLGVDPLRRDDAFLEQLRRLAGRADRITSVCTGALLLAAAGLLDGYGATTHWASCEQLARLHPEVGVQPDRIHVRDRDRWTSAGVTAGIDLALALVEEDHGAELAHAVAGWLVVFARRPGGQAQFSAQLLARPATRPTLRHLQEWMAEHLDSDLSNHALARRAGMSDRTFARAFRHETGTTPAVHVERLRVEAARRLLETSDLTVATIARRVGLPRAETLHRAFRRQVGTTPDRYRQHFARPPDCAATAHT